MAHGTSYLGTMRRRPPWHVLLLALFAYLVYRIVLIAAKAIRRNDTFLSLAAFGIAVLFGCQILINIGVASGFFPTKGLTLPFISYGGSSLIINCLLIALLLRIDYDLDRSVIADGQSILPVTPDVKQPI